MSLSHQIKEEETLLAYFKQILSEEATNFEEEGVAQETEQVAQSKVYADASSKSSVSNTTSNKDNKDNNESVSATVDENTHQQDVVTSTHTNSDTVEQDTRNFSDEHNPYLVKKDDYASEYGATPMMQKAQEVKESKAPFVTTASLETLLQGVGEVSETKVETEVAIKSETQVETKTQTQVETQTDTKVETQVDTKVDTKVDTATDTTTAYALELAQKIATATQTQTKTEVDSVTVKEDVKQTETQVAADMSEAHSSSEWQNIKTDEEFQTLFFTVQGVRFAVPLIDLGNILECDKVTTIFGKPKWYMGVTDNRGAKINIVDTLKWVKPEINESVEKYPYLISLSDSPWALGCDGLEGNKTLRRSCVKWRVKAGSRPWLAGIVKDEMCALLHVQALIDLFNQGVDHKDLQQKFAGDL